MPQQIIVPARFQQQQAQEQQAENEQQTTAATTTENATGEVDGQQQQQQTIADEKRFTQAELDAKIKERLEREREAAEKKKKAADDEAEKARLKEEGKLKELSEKQAADLLGLTTEKETLTAKVTEVEEERDYYKAILDKQLTEQKKALSEPVQKLLNALSLREQMAWMNENAAKLGITVKGVPATPKGTGNNGNDKDEEAAKQRAERAYSNF